MVARGYPNPPIVEALVELRFSGAEQWTTVEPRLLEAFGATHSGKRRELKRFAMSANWQHGTLATQASHDFDRWLLPNEGQREFIGLGRDVLSIHVQAPYPGWGSFKSTILQAFSQYDAIAKPIHLASVVVRYIDQIVLPAGIDLSDYFRAVPPKLESQPDNVDLLQVTTASMEPSTGIRSELTLAYGFPADNEGRVAIYDLTLSHQAAPGTPANGFSDTIERLHQRQKDIFEESITDKTRALFQ